MPTAITASLCIAHQTDRSFANTIRTSVIGHASASRVTRNGDNDASQCIWSLEMVRVDAERTGRARLILHHRRAPRQFANTPPDPESAPTSSLPISTRDESPQPPERLRQRAFRGREAQTDVTLPGLAEPNTRCQRNARLTNELRGKRR